MTALLIVGLVVIVAAVALLLAGKGCASIFGPGKLAGWPFDAAEAKRRQEEAARTLGVPVETELDLGDGVTMKLVLIPAGEFVMGSPENGARRSSSERPQHKVSLTRAFYMGVTEVTQEQYEKLMGKNPSYSKGAKNPVERVSWDDASEFCGELSARAGVQVRLPTEAEWEYACRAGSAGKYCFGDDESKLGEYAWYYDNAYDVEKRQPQQVGGKKPNGWGLYDMHGNVEEWCRDGWGWYTDAPVEDPSGPRAGEDRMLRGGDWILLAKYCRSAERRTCLQSASFWFLGFRVVLPLSEE